MPKVAKRVKHENEITVNRFKIVKETAYKYVPVSGKEILSTSKKVEEALRNIFDPGDLEVRESFYVLALNRSNNIVNHLLISMGSTSGTVVDMKMVLMFALNNLAEGIIISHNHPSGSLRPSRQDIALTNKIKEGAKLMDIQLIDHIILTEDSYYSFADEGML